MQDSRLQNIFESSCDLFINLGYTETKMKDIAKKSNISVGSMYDLFTSKKALLDFIFMTTLDESQIQYSGDLPIQGIDNSTLVKKTKNTYELKTEQLDQNLTEKNSKFTLESLITELFELFNIYGRYFLILEKNPNINRELIGLYENYRNKLYKNISTYLSNNIVSGKIRSLDNPFYDSMLIVDLIFWWATHKKYDSFENSKNNYSMDLMEKSISETLLQGYLEK
ncbi:TetR/AcrR family transcriptional regulator [Companilactobacillus mishanensis]|uniref:TetR/AcrR family transcriptional regulator n=1 Tax=Companilactobacillus mishanensis TaxID=2486008 RepID=A0A5P0ZHQ6_9LACO|nr:TetR/AcrR family transcriptional regulator [Companilactobacillus mishanensis]MQS52581.1 TetR/AcrR family transcriptional regulator [Companilactobacillus mishanensis]